jgi:hypothetical protein
MVGKAERAIKAALGTGGVEHELIEEADRKAKQA